MKQLQERFERMKDRQKFSWKSMVGETQMLLKIDQLQAMVECMTKNKGMVEEQGEHDLEKILVDVQSFEDKTCRQLNELIHDKSEVSWIIGWKTPGGGFGAFLGGLWCVLGVFLGV